MKKICPSCNKVYKYGEVCPNNCYSVYRIKKKIEIKKDILIIFDSEKMRELGRYKFELLCYNDLSKNVDVQVDEENKNVFIFDNNDSQKFIQYKLLEKL